MVYDDKEFIKAFDGTDKEFIEFLTNNTVTLVKHQLLALKSINDYMKKMINEIEYLNEELEAFHKEYSNNQHY